jgi:hypothetical protein
MDTEKASEPVRGGASTVHHPLAEALRIGCRVFSPASW